MITIVIEQVAPQIILVPYNSEEWVTGTIDSKINK